MGDGAGAVHRSGTTGLRAAPETTGRTSENNNSAALLDRSAAAQSIFGAAACVQSSPLAVRSPFSRPSTIERGLTSGQLPFAPPRRISRRLFALPFRPRQGRHAHSQSACLLFRRPLGHRLSRRMTTALTTLRSRSRADTTRRWVHGDDFAGT